MSFSGDLMRAIALGFQLALSVVRSNWQGFNFDAGILSQIT
jgi:hypothetical protein